MTIKSLVHFAHEHIQSTSSTSFKRSHIYELIASAFGFGSYAAFGSQAVLTTPENPPEKNLINATAIKKRCLELGYEFSIAEISSKAIADFLLEQNVCVIGIDRLLDRLRGVSFDETISDPISAALDSFGIEWVMWESLVSPLLTTCLENSASKNIAEAHFALALILGEKEYDGSAGSDYWYKQEQQGQILSGVQKEWADDYATRLANERNYGIHLREAARLGNQHAMLEMAEQFGDPTFFKQDDKSQLDVDPVEVAYIAQRLGRDEDAHYWLTKAAEAGDIDSIRSLIEDHDRDDAQKCWTWIYLAKLLGSDLTKDDYRAVHDNGSCYDDDVGGSMHVVGLEGIRLANLPEKQNSSAKEAADTLFARIT